LARSALKLHSESLKFNGPLRLPKKDNNSKRRDRCTNEAQCCWKMLLHQIVPKHQADRKKKQQDCASEYCEGYSRAYHSGQTQNAPEFFIPIWRITYPEPAQWTMTVAGGVVSWAMHGGARLKRRAHVALAMLPYWLQ
jgi:hypothetical protein